MVVAAFAKNAGLSDCRVLGECGYSRIPLGENVVELGPMEDFPMKRILIGSGVVAALAVWLLAVSSASGDVAAASTAPLSFEVRLPAEAQLVIDGYQTRSTGAVRRYASPPVSVGKTYTYHLVATHKGKTVKRSIVLRPHETLVVDLEREFNAAPPPEKEKPGPDKEKPKNPFPKPGFVTFEVNGHLWVFREKCKELDEFKRDGDLVKQVTRIGAGPKGMTIKGPDAETIVGYLTAQEGFETFLKDGSLWVFRTGSKDIDEFKKQGELVKQVTRIGAGPMRLTVKSADAETINDYLKAVRQKKK
jgi:uncharacterized protein (TIGR03000 family)